MQYLFECLYDTWLLMFGKTFYSYDEVWFITCPVHQYISAVSCNMKQQKMYLTPFTPYSPLHCPPSLLPCLPTSPPPSHLPDVLIRSGTSEYTVGGQGQVPFRCKALTLILRQYGTNCCTKGPV